jgi:hypothetical protein
MAWQQLRRRCYHGGWWPAMARERCLTPAGCGPATATGEQQSQSVDEHGLTHQTLTGPVEAGFPATGTSGSGGGPQKRTGRNTNTALRPDLTTSWVTRRRCWRCSVAGNGARTPGIDGLTERFGATTRRRRRSATPRRAARRPPPSSARTTSCAWRCRRPRRCAAAQSIHTHERLRRGVRTPDRTLRPHRPPHTADPRARPGAPPRPTRSDGLTSSGLEKRTWTLIEHVDELGERSRRSSKDSVQREIEEAACQPSGDSNERGGRRRRHGSWRRSRAGGIPPRSDPGRVGCALHRGRDLRPAPRGVPHIRRATVP